MASRSPPRRGRWLWAAWLGWSAAALGCTAPIAEDLTQAQATHFAQRLRGAGWQVHVAPQGQRYALQVAAAQEGSARRALAVVRDLPAPREARSTERWVLSPTEARLVAQQRRLEALEAMLEARPGVLAARLSLAAQSAALVVHHEAKRPPEAAALAALVRSGAGLAAEAPVRVELWPQPWPPEEAPEAAGWSARRVVAGGLIALGLLGLAVFALRRAWGRGRS